ncbi:glycosyltransferase family 2 protein [Flexithrix dorotheae]|uniref:glycosyltransferase family 2 protein n=1 Tax=Flexithrix dorotheae TaxID=70993 RepID=UPI00037FE9EA|nr:glycosyltransferase family 2 protein [Flexithrix dorotheae]
MNKINQNPQVSIITVNYNQTQVTCEFLDSLEKNSFKNYEVIVIDNASIENPTSTILLKYPWVKVVTSEENLGFAGGNNLGIKIAKGEYLLFVNNDTEITENFFEPLIHQLQSNPDVGIVSPKIKYFSHPEIIQYAGFSKINSITGRNRTIGKKQKDLGQFNEPTNTHYAHGAAMMVSKKVIDKVGGMPEAFFLYYEEMDWCEKIKRAGFKIMYEPKSLIFHKESISVGNKNPLKTYYQTRNRILFMIRNFGGWNLLVFAFFFIFLTVPKWSVTYLVKGEISYLKAFFRGIFWHFKLEKVPIGH